MNIVRLSLFSTFEQRPEDKVAPGYVSMLKLTPAMAYNNNNNNNNNNDNNNNIYVYIYIYIYIGMYMCMCVYI